EACGRSGSGGEGVKPHLVDRVTSATGELLEEQHREERQVVSEATASTLKEMLEGVVRQGTGKAARMGAYSAAGKTGTAQKVDEATGRYSQTRYVASFAGFAPVENPEIVCVVSIDEPVGAHLGGAVSARVFARVVADALHILGVPPEDDPQSLLAGVLQVYNIADFSAETQTASSEESVDTRPALQVSAEAPNDNFASKRSGPTVVMPDLIGKGIREALSLCASEGIKLKASGDGVVSLQNPSPGALVSPQTTCRVKLSREAARKLDVEPTMKTPSSGDPPHSKAGRTN